MVVVIVSVKLFISRIVAEWKFRRQNVSKPVDESM